MKDSPEIAHRDKIITVLNYHEGQFREFFTSPYRQYAEHIGKPFHVVKKIQPSKEETENSDGQEVMYLIRLEGKIEIEAFGHEVCVLDYENCVPKL